MTILSRSSRRRRRHGRGQTLVEFALVIPIFLLILMTLIDFGRVVYAQHTINQDAAEGARVGAVSATTLVTTAEFNARYAAIRAAARLMAPAVPMTDASITGGRKTDGTALRCSLVTAYNGGTPTMSDDAVTPADTNVRDACFYPNGVKNTATATPPRITVRITVSVPLLTPIVSSIVGGAISLSATSTQLLQ